MLPRCSPHKTLLLSFLQQKHVHFLTFSLSGQRTEKSAGERRTTTKSASSSLVSKTKTRSKANRHSQARISVHVLVKAVSLRANRDSLTQMRGAC